MLQNMQIKLHSAQSLSDDDDDDEDDDDDDDNDEADMTAGEYMMICDDDNFQI
jgi:hypothetical protein